MNIDDVLGRLQGYVAAEDHIGYDPYDGLNSRLFCSLGLDRLRWAGIAWTQFFKRCPVNLRPLVLIDKQFNAKAGGLFLSAYADLFKQAGDARYEDLCASFVERLKGTALSTKRGIAWGYNFDWRARAFFVSKKCPNTVTTVFVAKALLDWFEISGDKEILVVLRRVVDFISQEAIIWESERRLCFAYVLGDKTEVHNANLLAAAFLARFVRLEAARDGGLLGDADRLLELVGKATRFSLDDVAEDGFWPYGTRAHHRWMDCFHTGFNIEALLEIARNDGGRARELIDNESLVRSIKKIYNYYIRSFFINDGIVTYYNNKTYPLDVHNNAVSLIVLARVVSGVDDLFNLDDRSKAGELLRRVCVGTVRDFWDKRGFFYSRRGRFFVNKIPYMRWAQAWMLRALVCVKSTGEWGKE